MITGSRLRIAVALLGAAVLPFLAAPVPTHATTVPAISAIAATATHACALTRAGGVKCWGYGRFGQLGTGTTAAHLTPFDVDGLTSGSTAIATGNLSSCALTKVGGVKCWGYGKAGELGTGARETSLSPADVVGLPSAVTDITMGDSFTCALTSAGAVMCWGFLQVAPLAMAPSSIPVEIEGLAGGVTAISAGRSHACALTDQGGVKCWGSAGSGQLGSGSTTAVDHPVDVTGLGNGVRAISAGFNHTCAITSRGGVKCWGYNGYGQLGDGSKVNSTIPVDVVGLTGGVTAISAGILHTCAIASGGAVKCWGYNTFGQLSLGTSNSRVPVGASSLSKGMTAVVAANGYTCALSKVGMVKCWGTNYYGQLGNGTRKDSRVPVTVDFATHQTIDLQASTPAGTIASGTAVTFSAAVRPLGPAGTPVIVRFVIYRQEDAVWRADAHRDVVADASGQATLRWTFVTTGQRHVRAQALANATFAASPWSSRFFYSVR